MHTIHKCNAEALLSGLEISRKAQDHITKKNKMLLLAKVSDYQYMCKIADFVGWKKLLDHALDHSPSIIKGLKNLVRVITYPDHAITKCPLCNVSQLDQMPLVEHFIT